MKVLCLKFLGTNEKKAKFRSGFQEEKRVIFTYGKCGISEVIFVVRGTGGVELNILYPRAYQRLACLREMELL